MALFRSILQRAIGPDKNFVKLQIKKHIRKEIKNEELKDALRELCSDEEYADLDKWFPDKEDEKIEENEIAFHAEIEEELANLKYDDVIKAVRKSISKRKRCRSEECGAKVAPKKLCSCNGCDNQVREEDCV
eukprot:scaffold177_cov113-Skeletonema_dohrnii-CCMP3373.AAC.10